MGRRIAVSESSLQNPSETAGSTLEALRMNHGQKWAGIEEPSLEKASWNGKRIFITELWITE